MEIFQSVPLLPVVTEYDEVIMARPGEAYLRSYTQYMVAVSEAGYFQHYFEHGFTSFKNHILLTKHYEPIIHRSRICRPCIQHLLL